MKQQAFVYLEEDDIMFSVPPSGSERHIQLIRNMTHYVKYFNTTVVNYHRHDISEEWIIEFGHPININGKFEGIILNEFHFNRTLSFQTSSFI